MATIQVSIESHLRPLGSCPVRIRRRTGYKVSSYLAVTTVGLISLMACCQDSQTLFKTYESLEVGALCFSLMGVIPGGISGEAVRPK